MRSVKIIPGIIILVVFSGCENINKIFKGDNAEKEMRREVVVLLDVTGSTKDTRGDFVYPMERIFKALNPGDALIILKIEGMREVQLKPLFELELPSLEGAPNQYHKDKLKRQVERSKVDTFNYFINNIFNKKVAKVEGSNFSDLIGAIKLGAVCFKVSQDRKKVLVILSDMIQDTGDLNFEKVVPDEKLTDSIISRTSDFPDLRGVTVYIAGLKHEIREKKEKIALFWRRYLERAGASEVIFDDMLISFR